MLVFDQLKKNDVQLQVLALVLCLGLGILSVGLWWVQVVSAKRYQESMETQSLRTVRLSGPRGKIFDRNGTVLAENRPSYNVNLYLEDLSPAFRKEYSRSYPREVITNDLPFWKDWLGMPTVKTQSVKLTAEQRLAVRRDSQFRVANTIVAQVGKMVNLPLSLDYTNFHKHFDRSRIMPFTVVSNLSPERLACFAEQSVNVPGLDLEIQPLRYYPQGNVAAHVLGYVRRGNESVNNEQSYYDFRLDDFMGNAGIERTFDIELRGAAGEKTVVVNNLGFRQGENIITPIEPGRNVYLTLDVNVQKAAETALRTHAGLGGKGAVVVMDVKSGDILAMASTPSMDPNTHVRKLTPEEQRRWTDDEMGMQKNRATFETYQAGSIFKPIVALAALETPQARFNPAEKYRVEPNPRGGGGAILVGNRYFHDTVHPGEYDLERALAESSNSYFISTGLRPGVFERVVELSRHLHLGEKVGVKLMESPGLFPTVQEVKSSRWRDGDTANVCIGQGILAVTPLQMAVMTCALANGGQVLIPRLIARMESQDPASVEAPTNFPNYQVRDHLGISERSMRILHEAMLSETENKGGTGYPAFNPYYQSGGTMRACGKTGTAEREKRGPDGRKENTTWFVSFAPYPRPQYAVVVAIENGISGGTSCAPVARDVYIALEKVGKTANPRPVTANR